MIGMVEAASLVPLAKKPFPRLSYAEAMARYGTDRPDIRFGLELVDIGDLVADSAFRVFNRAIEKSDSQLAMIRRNGKTLAAMKIGKEPLRGGMI